MNKQMIFNIFTIIVVIGALVAYQQGVIPNKGNVDSTANSNANINVASGPGNTPNQENWAQGLDLSANTILAYEDIVQVLANVDVNQKRALLENEEAFNNFVNQEASQKALLTAANANNLNQDKNSKFLMQRSAENVLREIYVSKLINSKIPVGFPTEEQITQYYDSNKDNLVIEERVAVWQIFLPVKEGMSDGDISALEDQANKLADDIKANRTDFTSAALSYSSHQPSKLNGGNMGILKVSELIPGIHETLMELDEDVVSSAVKSEMGFHILKRGQVIPSQGVTLEQVRAQISNLLVNQVRAKLRNEILTLASETYPVQVNEETMSEWRSFLNKDLQSIE
ncbi:MAG: parvulin-like peptidyl-prolyl isomerase [Gammaproteobacteria bacterium]|jgi:parvulin-like peptidyl-prolyl isomerase